MSVKIRKWLVLADEIHRDWCRKNGYPTNWTRARAGRPKLNKQANKQEGKYVENRNNNR